MSPTVLIVDDKPNMLALTATGLAFV